MSKRYKTPPTTPINITPEAERAYTEHVTWARPLPLPTGGDNRPILWNHGVPDDRDVFRTATVNDLARILQQMVSLNVSVNATRRQINDISRNDDAPEADN